MRSLGKIFLYAVLVLVSGALAAPQAWVLIQKLPAGMLHGLVGTVQGMPFHRYLSRSIQVASIVLLWPLLCTLHVRSLQELGLYGNPCRLRDLVAGMAAGIPSAALLVTASLISGAFEIHSGWSPSVVPRIVLTSIVVAALEEFLFRGVILGFLRQFLGRWFAILLSAVIFSGLHFLNLPSSGSEAASPEWWAGFHALASVKNTLPPWPLLGWTLSTLMLAGIVLGWMTTRTGSLWAPIGLHGSWIFGQQIFNSMAGYRHLPGEAFLPYIGPAQCHGAVPVGLDALLSLLLAGALAAMLLKKRPYPRLFSRVSQ